MAVLVVVGVGVSVGAFVGTGVLVGVAVGGFVVGIEVGGRDTGMSVAAVADGLGVGVGVDCRGFRVGAPVCIARTGVGTGIVAATVGRTVGVAGGGSSVPPIPMIVETANAVIPMVTVRDTAATAFFLMSSPMPGLLLGITDMPLASMRFWAWMASSTMELSSVHRA